MNSSKTNILTSASRSNKLSAYSNRIFIAALLLFGSMMFGVFAKTAQADPNALAIDVRVTLHSESGDTSVIVDERSWEVPLDKRFSSFLANFSVEIRAKRIDTLRSEITVFIATVGPRPDSRTKQFLIEHTLPARIENIRGKNGATYTLTLYPQEYIEIDLEECLYDHRGDDAFKFDPTANFDLYYVKRSLGDYHWNKIKSLLEDDYRPFRDVFDITVSGKLNYFLYPCASPTIDWDPRFGYAIDPTRSQAISIYNHDYMAASPLVATLMQTLRVFGYAPPFLSEGISSYLFFNNFETLQALSDSALLPLAPLLTTVGYSQADANLATAQGGSFCRFLADEHGITKVMRWYKGANDLNIEQLFQEIFGASIYEFERLWVTYLQGLQPTHRTFIKRAGLEGAFGNPDGAIAVLQAGLRWNLTLRDTLKSLEALAPLYAETGRNDLALRTYHALYNTVDEAHGRTLYYLMRRGYFHMLTGDFESSLKDFAALQAKDTLVNDVALYNIARIHLTAGDTASAVDDLTELMGRSREQVILTESALHLAYIFGQPGEFSDPQKGGEMFLRAYSLASHLVNNFPQEPLNRLRQGLAAIGLGKYDFARQSLDVALFMEFRPRYLNRELVGLGNIADMQGDREAALEFYNRAKEADKSAPGQLSAKRYLQAPCALTVTFPDDTQ